MNYPVPRIENILKALAFSFPLSCIPVSEGVRAQTHDILACHQDIDISWVVEPYTVQAGDTVWTIYTERWIDATMMYLVWNHVHGPESEHPIDINTIKAGQTILIPKENSSTIISLYVQQLEAEKRFYDIQQAWESGNFTFLESQYGFSVFPKAQISIGIEENMAILWRLFQDSPKNLGPRTVDVAWQNLVICANLVRRYMGYAFDITDSDLSPELREMLSEENINAWMFHDFYTSYRFQSVSDFTAFFTRNFTKGSVPILSTYTQDYETWLLDLLQYLKKEGVPGTFIPALFRYTNAWPSIYWYNKWERPNSHVFAYVGEYLSNPFPASDFLPIKNGAREENFEEGILVTDFIIDIAQSLGWVWGSFSVGMDQTLSQNLPKFSNFIEFYVNDQRINLSEQFQNPSLQIRSTDSIRIGWSIVMDGLHIYTSEDPDLRENMNARILLLPFVLSMNMFYPTEALVPPNTLLDVGYQGWYGEMLRHIQILKYFDLRVWEDPRDKYFDMIAQEYFSLESYEAGTFEQQREVERLYGLQSMALQMFGYQKLWGSEWNPSATKINAPMPYFDTSHVEEVYQQVVELRKNEFYSLMLPTLCAPWETPLRLPFFQFIVFPGDTTTSLLHQITSYLTYESPQYWEWLRYFDAYQKQELMRNIFWESVAQGILAEGQKFYISRETLLQEIESIAQQGYIWRIWLRDISWKASFDETLLSVATMPQNLENMLRFILLQESYIPSCRECWEFYERFVWPIDRLISRKNIKRMLIELDERGLLSHIWLEAPSSISDFQMRFANLLWSQAGEVWPQYSSLRESIDELLNPSGTYETLISDIETQFPDIVSQDRHYLEDIQKLLSSDDVNGSDIYELLRKLLRMDDGTHSNILGKILSLELLREKLLEHSSNIQLQLELSWETEVLENQSLRERYARLVLLANNMGEGTQLLAVHENYVQRILTTLSSEYEISVSFPEIEVNDNIRNQFIYNRSIWRSHMQAYISQLDLFPQDPFIQQFRTDLETLSQINWGFTAMIYSFQWNQSYKDFLRSAWEDNSILPTDEEFNKLIFRYVQDRHILERVSDPEIKKEDFVLPLWIGFIFFAWMTSRISGTIMQWWMHRRYRKYETQKRRKNRHIREQKQFFLPLFQWVYKTLTWPRRFWEFLWKKIWKI